MNSLSPHWLRSRIWLAASLAAALGLSGCVVAPVDGYYDSGSTYYETGTYVDGYYGGTYYPARPVEVIPVAPYAGAIWINGYWDTSRGHRHWIPSRYERPSYRPGIRPDNRPDWNRPGWQRPDGNRPGAHRPDRPRPDGQRPDWNRVDRPRPDGNRPGWNRPNGPRPESNRPNPRPPRIDAPRSRFESIRPQ